MERHEVGISVTHCSVIFAGLESGEYLERPKVSIRRLHGITACFSCHGEGKMRCARVGKLKKYRQFDRLSGNPSSSPEKLLKQR
jgi:hypothetical protein